MAKPCSSAIPKTSAVKKDEVERSEHRAFRYAAFNYGYVRRRPTVVAYVLSPTCDVRDDPIECIFVNAEGYVQSPDVDDMVNAVERGTHVERIPSRVSSP